MGNDDDPIFAAELRELFDRAIELAGEVREAFVREQCRARPELEAALRRLIEHHETLGTFLAAPVVARRPLAETPAPLSGLLLRPGDELGGYDIDDYLGGGGGLRLGGARLDARLFHGLGPCGEVGDPVLELGFQRVERAREAMHRFFERAHW